jgi:hypothetical protein
VGDSARHSETELKKTASLRHKSGLEHTHVFTGPSTPESHKYFSKNAVAEAKIEVAPFELVAAGPFQENTG